MIYCNFFHSYLVLIMIKNFKLFLLLVIFLLASVSKTYAASYFVDDFNIKDESKWNYLENGGSIVFDNGEMQLSSSSSSFPYITNSGVDIFSDKENVFVEFKFRYSSTGFMGNGLGIGYTGNDGYPYYQISIWNDLTTGPVLQYQDNSVFRGEHCDYSKGLKKKNISEYIGGNPRGDILRIEKHGTSFSVFVNSFEVLKTPENQCTPRNIFLGNPLTGGGTNWTKLSIDNVQVSDTPQIKIKTILLPGLGASWNTEAMMVGSTTIDSGWRMTPFVHNYDKLISAFEGNGLVRGKDFYVWNYDWRKPLSAIVADFDNFISGLNLGGDEKLNLVGHSLGGLVARLWTQDHGDMVNKTVTLGSPHYGSVKAYLAWNGLRFGDNSMANIALNVFLGLRSADGGVRVKNLRKFAPIVFDLNPTFSFLKKNGSVAVSPSSQYLKEMNGRDSLITPLLVTANGVGVETFSQVTLGDRTMFDKVLGVWEEGRPVAYEKSEGDGTVLKTSALIKGNKNLEIVSNHGDIVDKTINELMDEFGLKRPVALLKRGVVLAANPEMFIFFTDFKGEMKVICDGQEKSDVDGWVWFENVDREKCQTYFSGTANDNYKLIAGSGDEWQSLTGSLDNEGKSQLSISQESLSWKVLRQQADKLGAVNMFSEIDKKDILTTIDAYISFRTKSKNTKYSEDIIESLKILLKGQNKSGMEIDKQNLSAKNAKVMAETNLRLLVRKGVKPSYYSSLTYDQAEVLMTEGKNYAANYLAEKLYKIIWK